MNTRDRLGEELKKIMDEDSESIVLSSDFMNRIIEKSKPTPISRVRDFLNSEIEIPLAPALIGFAALIAITIIPKDIFKDNSIQVIDIGGSQIIIRDDREVADN
jgi:hypothetical protein